MVRMREMVWRRRGGGWPLGGLLSLLPLSRCVVGDVVFLVG